MSNNRTRYKVVIHYKQGPMKKTTLPRTYSKSKIYGMLLVYDGANVEKIELIPQLAGTLKKPMAILQREVGENV